MAQQQVQTRKIVGFGHSHLSALQFAYEGWRKAHQSAQNAIEFLQILSPEFKLSDISFNYDLLIARLVSQFDGHAPAPEFVFTCFSGNDYHVLSMVQHPQPFDFVLDERTDMKLREGVQVLPSSAVEATMQQTIKPATDQLAAIKQALPCRMYAISSPPPIPDNAFLHRPENAFWSKAQELGISPPEFRWKVWRLQCLAYERGCIQAGITYVPPPLEAVDENGFMRRQGWHPDGVHGSAWYGALVLDQIANVI